MSILKDLYESDINDRRSRDWDKASKKELKWLDKRDKERKTQVIYLFKNNKIRAAKDFHHAALIMQHGKTSHDYKLAHHFAKKALELGDETTRWLFAASLDRFLVSSGKPQKFGTQFEKSNKGEWRLIQPVDPTTTDEERSKYNVSPLAKALQKFKEKYGIK